MRITGVAVSAVIGLLAVGGCSKPSNEAKSKPTPAATNATASVASAGAYKIGPCERGAPETDTQTYTLTLGPNFKMRHADTTHGGHKEAKAKQIPGHNPTLLDIFTDAQGTPPSKWGTVKIILDDKRLHFRTDGNALRGGEDWAPELFCGVAMDTTDPKDPRWLTVRLRRNTNYPSYATFNIGLIVSDEKVDGVELPIFIDPVVDNDGLDAS